MIAKSASQSAADLREAALKADVPAGSYINGWGLKFDEKGQNQRAFGSVVQWQEQRMVSVYPLASKVKEPTCAAAGLERALSRPRSRLRTPEDPSWISTSS